MKGRQIIQLKKKKSNQIPFGFKGDSCDDSLPFRKKIRTLASFTTADF